MTTMTTIYFNVGGKIMKNSQVIQDIKDYISEHELCSIPQLQCEFSLNYYNAHKIIETLIKQKFIKYNGGIEYKLVYKSKARGRLSAQDDNNPFTHNEKILSEYRAAIEKRRQDIIDRTNNAADPNKPNGDTNNDSDNKYDDNNNQADSGDTKDENDDISDIDCGDKDLPSRLINERNVTKFLRRLIKSDSNLTRTLAIKKLSTYAINARAKGFMNCYNFLRMVEQRLLSMTDYKYKKLRQDINDGGE
jgi:hypothetical protein